MRLLSLARDLRRRRSRERNTLFVAEGVRAAEELLASPLRLVGALTAPHLTETSRGAALRKTIASRGIDVADVTAAEFESAADTDSPQGVLMLAEIPARRLADHAAAEPSRLLVLDSVQDPGNAGTLIRTAAGLGATATVALPGTVDLWNAKVVRSAMGAHFVHPAFHCTWDELRLFLQATGTSLWGADARGLPLAHGGAPPRLALAVGNEGAGLTEPVREAAHRLVSLPLAGGIESLNVGVAAGILLYELRP